MKIYTKTGDSGETAFIGGRISKASSLMDVIGSLDELGAHLGLVATTVTDTKLKSLKENIFHVQNVLFNCGAAVADLNKEMPVGEMYNFEAEVTKLEKGIDQLDKDLAVLQNFILAGGSPVASHLHLARTVCRRTERNLITLLETTPELGEAYTLSMKQVAKYLNRLSDWLFVYARWANKQLDVSDVEWDKLG